MGTCCLRHLVVRLGFDSVYQIREFDGVLDKKDRHVVAHQIPVALVGVKLDGKTAYVTRGVFGPALTLHSRKPYKYRRNLAGFLERCCFGVLRQGRIAFEKAVCCRSTRMNNPFRDSFMVKVGEFLAQNEIFKECRSTQAHFQRILIV